MTEIDTAAKEETVAKGSDTGADRPYAMTLNLNVLTHLGLNLYSNVPAVLSEVVANAYDADATTVHIALDAQGGRITITDDGHGMTREQVNARFLDVGFDRRANQGALSEETKRPVMGRKGIGKLSLFSVAEVIEVQTVRAGEKSALRMVVQDIKKQIADEPSATYHPTPLDESLVDFDRGTRIVLTDLKKSIHQVAGGLRRRVARRFGIIGEEHNFHVYIDGAPITVEDRDYFHKLEYMWWYGDESKTFVSYAHNLTHNEQRKASVGERYAIRGWLGSVDEAKKLKDPDENLNRVVILVRGKLAQEDILSDFNEGGIYSKYLIGEVHADFLDLDDEDDIATSSRQKIIEEDPRYKLLKDFVYDELKHIETSWKKLRNKKGTKTALDIPAIKEWYDSLQGNDEKRHARALFGRINQLTIEDSEKRRLFKHALLAFESLRYKRNLDALRGISLDNLQAVADVFTSLEDIEATLYHQIVSERVRIIETLNQHVDEDVRERVIQEHVFKDLWLLDPSWERATDTQYMEEKVGKAFQEIEEKLTETEKASRIDIRYAKTSGEHVIVELKRANRIVSSTEVIDQVSKYRNALMKLLQEQNRGHEPVEVVVVVGRKLSDWSDERGHEESLKMLATKHIRPILYQELLQNAYKAYQAYIEKRADVGRLTQLMERLENEDIEVDEPDQEATSNGGPSTRRPTSNQNEAEADWPP